MIDAVRTLLCRSAPSRGLSKTELVEEYIRSGQVGLALAVYRGLDSNQQRATLAAVIERRQHDLPHPFEPRSHGSKKACWCGAERANPIHINQQPPPRRPPRSRPRPGNG